MVLNILHEKVYVLEILLFFVIFINYLINNLSLYLNSSISSKLIALSKLYLLNGKCILKSIEKL